MPNSAFSTECRVPENAERRWFGFDFSQLPASCVRHYLRCSAARLEASEAHRPGGNEPVCCSVASFWLAKSEMNVQISLSGCHDLCHSQSAIIELSTPTCNSSVAELRRNLRAGVESSSGILKTHFVLNSSPLPSRGAGRRHRTMPHARIVSPLKSRPKRQSLGIFRDSAFWRRSCRRG